MDPARLYVLLVGIVATAALLALFAGIFDFRIDAGFWGFLGGVVTLIGTLAFKAPRNGDDEKR